MTASLGPGESMELNLDHLTVGPSRDPVMTVTYHTAARSAR
jgi:hypothetical protein